MAGAWSDADRALVEQRVRAVAALPGVTAEVAGGHTGFSVSGKRFGWLLVDHHGDGRLVLQVKAPPGVQEALVARSSAFCRPPYLADRGWVGIDLAPGAGADWDEVEELVEQAWRMTAGTRLLAQRPAAG